MMMEGGFFGESFVEGFVGIEFGRLLECDVNMRGGDFKYCYKDFVGDGWGKERVWKWRCFYVVDMEEGVEGWIGGCFDVSYGEVLVLKCLLVLVGKGVVEEEGFEVIFVMGFVVING